MALLDLLQSPQGVLGLNVLSNAERPALGLLQGLQQNQAFQQNEQQSAILRLQQELAKQKILESQQGSERAGQQRELLSDLPTEGQPPLAQGLLQAAALSDDPVTGITGVLNAFKTGTQSQTSAVKNAIALGLQPGTQEFDQFVRAQVLKPSTQISIGDSKFKVPPGFMVDPQDPGRVVPIPGGPVTRKTPEQAAKISLLSTAKELIPDIISALMPTDETGKQSVDRTLVATMSANVPFSEGRLARTRLLDAVEAKLRAESGAAVPQQEVKRAAIRFMPSVADSDKSIIDKMDRLEKFLDTALEVSDPELFKRLTDGKVSPEGKVQSRRTLNGVSYIKQNGQWFEVQ